MKHLINFSWFKNLGMSITREELEHLAKLSKLKLTEEEKEKYLNNMDSIIQFLDQLKTPENVELLDEEKLRSFSNGEYFENPKKLLENSAHKK
jgi:aspartyl-tRNA(Asn)/glutamyl-tRNA(Gln) amidotransferase subunit C